MCILPYNLMVKDWTLEGTSGICLLRDWPGCIVCCLTCRLGLWWLIDMMHEKSFGEGNGTPLQYSCLENPMDGGAWWAAVHGVTESRTRLSDFTLTFHYHALEKGNGNPVQCSCLENPGTGEPCGLPSMGSHRVRHDWSDLAAAAAAAKWGGKVDGNC